MRICGAGCKVKAQSHSFDESALIVGRTPWSAADALVGLLTLQVPDVIWSIPGRGRPARTRGSAPQILLNARQLGGARAQFADGSGDQLHRSSRGEEHVLGEPDGLFAEAIVLGTSIALLPLGQYFAWKKSLIPAGG